jgi:DNA recombination protein RmuC
MTEPAVLALIILVLVNIFLTVALVGRKAKPDSLEQGLQRTDALLRAELARVRDEAGINARHAREELSGALRSFGETVMNRLAESAYLQKVQMDSFAAALERLTGANEQKFEKIRETLESSLKDIREENSGKLEQMRATVDEKLNDTLEKRLGESFKLVSDRLEQVHKGLGEMQTLAAGVGDLKKVLSNVRARGTLGEIQLETILEQILSPEQYARNVATRKGSERVEFAIRLPGRDSGEPVWLPLDAKFPLEDYQRLLDAYEQADPAAVEEASRQMEAGIKTAARSIRDKYLEPPLTTDFGIMFLPVEGLYAEVLRRSGLFELLQKEYRVIVTGPTTLAALLNSLQMGFRTLAIEKRSGEVWELLGAIKAEFGKFGATLAKTQKKLQEASDTIEEAGRKSRSIERRLKSVQELPAPEAAMLLGFGETGEEAGESAS